MFESCFAKIQNVYRRICESAELDALKRRLDGITPIQTLRSFIDMTKNEKVNALIESGAVSECIGASSRIALLTNDGTVLKIANNEKGLAQNKAEAYNAAEKNRYGCFAKVLWVSRTRFALEMEIVSKLDGSDLEFEEITGVNIDDYFDYLQYERFSTMTPKKRDVVYRAYFSKERESGNVSSKMEWLRESHAKVAEYLMSQSSSNVAATVLKNLAQYIRTHNSTADFSFRDLASTNNWGKVERDGQEVCVVLDHGASEWVLNHMYHGLDTTGLQGYVR